MLIDKRDYAQRIYREVMLKKQELQKLGLEDPNRHLNEGLQLPPRPAGSYEELKVEKLSD